MPAPVKYEYFTPGLLGMAMTEAPGSEPRDGKAYAAVGVWTFRKKYSRVR